MGRDWKRAAEHSGTAPALHPTESHQTTDAVCRRTSTAYLRSNQLRLYFSSVAYVLQQLLRHLGLAGTELVKAQCVTIRLKLLKIGALVRISVRKVWVSLAGGYPYVALFRQVHERLCAVLLKC